MLRGALSAVICDRVNTILPVGVAAWAEMAEAAEAEATTAAIAAWRSWCDFIWNPLRQTCCGMQVQSRQCNL